MGEERKTRRRTNFDFDIWAEDEDNKLKLPSKEWVDEEALIHTAKGKSKHMPKAAAKRDFSTGSLLPAVEVPHAGSSYNPSVEEHQELLWKATMVELAKEKELKRIEMQTTAMFPSKGKAPTAQDRVKEMSEGILELNQDEEDDNDEEGEEDEGGKDQGDGGDEGEVFEEGAVQGGPEDPGEPGEEGETASGENVRANSALKLQVRASGA